MAVDSIADPAEDTAAADNTADPEGDTAAAGGTVDPAGGMAAAEDTADPVEDTAEAPAGDKAAAVVVPVGVAADIDRLDPLDSLPLLLIKTSLCMNIIYHLLKTFVNRKPVA